MANVQHYFHQLRVLPFKEVVRRALDIGNQAVQSRIGKVRARIFGTVLSDQHFFEHAVNLSGRSRDEILAHFRRWSHPVFFIDSSRRDELCNALLSQSVGAERSIVVQADKIRAHIFNLLGSGDVHLGDSIDWHSDFKTGYCWNPKTYYRNIGIPYGVADIKVPWELSRFSHAVSLGQAYWLTKDEKYAIEFASQIDDWIDSNKPKFGVNWACTMDVAIRVCNWIIGYSFFKDSPEITDKFLLKFLKSLYQHGKHIRANLEYSEFLTSNHYLSNITGLVYLGVMFPEFREAKEWKTFGIQELVKEMRKQVYADGCDFEASTCYHRLVIELFFFSTLVVVVNDAEFNGRNHRDISGKVFGKEYADKLYRMFEAVLYLLKPNGMMPQIGDNDSGRFHVFAGRKVLDMRYLLTLGAVFFHEPAFKVKEFGFCEDALWIFGEDGYKTWQGLEENTLENLMSRSFPDVGWYVMRNSRDYLLISCGPNGQNNNGGHAHNDKLSFELCLDGEDIFIDPGTYVYTPEPEMRNLFRSTAYHNTVGIEGLEQNRHDVSSYGLFRMNDESKANVIYWESKNEQYLFSGKHFGFEKDGYHHQRTIRFMKTDGTVRISDDVTGKSPQAVAYFHCKTGFSMVEQDAGTFSAGNALITFKGHDRIEIADSWYSPEYGGKEKSFCMKVFFGNLLETSISREKPS